MGVTGVWLELTQGTVFEGGRKRHPLELYFKVDQAAAAFFGDEAFTVRTDDGGRLRARVSGRSGSGVGPGWGKNLRSNPVQGFGEWLVGRRGFSKAALLGQRVRFSAVGAGEFYARYQPQEGRR